MTDRPILFSAPMVRAILAGTKTQTRRIVKPTSRQADGVCTYSQGGRVIEVLNALEREPIDAPPIPCPFGVPGDRLWVRETWGVSRIYDTCAPRDIHPGAGLAYAASGGIAGVKLRPSIHMPRWASRLTLAITSVRVERLQSITPEDAISEGVFGEGRYASMPPLPYPVATFAALWSDVYGAASWDANPWVWVVGFQRIEVTS